MSIEIALTNLMERIKNGGGLHGMVDYKNGATAVSHLHLLNFHPGPLDKDFL